jgi:hypothetical protein
MEATVAGASNKEIFFFKKSLTIFSTLKDGHGW